MSNQIATCLGCQAYNRPLHPTSWVTTLLEGRGRSQNHFFSLIYDIQSDQNDLDHYKFREPLNNIRERGASRYIGVDDKPNFLITIIF